MAEGGSLLLDEIGEMPPYLQTKLLRVLQEREYRPIGSDRIVRVDFRLVCATNIDLDTALRDGKLREDLYFRINTITLRVPPLRERTEDIPLLCEHFLEKYRQRHQRNVKSIAPAAYHVLIRHRWPGNVRELENVIERGVLVAKGTEITVTDLPESLRTESTTAAEFVIPPHRTLAEIEKMAIVQTLQRTNWNKQEAAQILGLYRPTLYSKMKKHEIQDGGKSAVRRSRTTLTPGLASCLQTRTGRMLERAGRLVVTLLAAAGDVRFSASEALRELFAPPFEFRETIRQLFELGLRSAPLIAVSGMAVGVVLSMHTRASLERFGAESMIPAGLAIALVRETGPLTCGLLLSGRIGAGIGAELGAMRVTEQIDALEASAVDAFRYLVVTRVAACIIALPILTTIMNFAGMIGGFLAETSRHRHAAAALLQPRVLDRRPDRLRAGDGQDDGLRVHHRDHLVVSRLHHRVGHRRRRPRLDAGGRVLVDLHHRRQRGAGPADLLHLPEGGGRMTRRRCRARGDAAGGGRRDEPAVRLDHVTKAFGTRTVLDDVSFDGAAGTAAS